MPFARKQYIKISQKFDVCELFTWPIAFICLNICFYICSLIMCIFALQLYAYTHSRSYIQVWKSVISLWALALSFHMVDPRIKHRILGFEKSMFTCWAIWASLKGLFWSIFMWILSTTRSAKICHSRYKRLILKHGSLPSTL